MSVTTDPITIPVKDPASASLVSMLTWNVNSRSKRLDEQADWVIGRHPDIVCLQEVTRNALPRWTARLEAAGYAVAASAVPDASPGHRLGVLIASRLPLAVVRRPTVVPWPERLLVADVFPGDWSRALHVVCLHAPNLFSADQAKMRTFEAVSGSLAGLDPRVPAVLCGDLNTPQYEARDEIIQTFAQTPTGRLQAGLTQQHDQAERMILRPPGWSDAFRSLHGYQARDRSWKSSRGTNPGYRLDHILVSSILTAVACVYDHDVREQRLSDHSAMCATVALAPDQPAAETADYL